MTGPARKSGGLRTVCSSTLMPIVSIDTEDSRFISSTRMSLTMTEGACLLCRQSRLQRGRLRNDGIGLPLIAWAQSRKEEHCIGYLNGHLRVGKLKGNL